ncbi:MAG: hypothetical protein KDA05_04185, partial [Phycisphaerales bacterium]|nr:hypothetical protein [Phycisphaerales bacterium]
LTVRNTFFPFWELMVQHLFNNASDILAMGMSPMKSFLGKPAEMLGKAKDKVDEADQKIKDVQDKVGKVQDQLSSIDEKDMAAFASDPEGFIDNMMKDDPAGALGGDAPEAPPPVFPGSPREGKGTGQDIDGDKAEEIGFVDTEPLPEEEQEDADDAPAAAGAGAGSATP